MFTSLAFYEWGCFFLKNINNAVPLPVRDKKIINNAVPLPVRGKSISSIYLRKMNKMVYVALNWREYFVIIRHNFQLYMNT